MILQDNKKKSHFNTIKNNTSLLNGSELTLIAGSPFLLAVVVLVIYWFGNDREMDFWSQYCIQENALLVIYKIVIPIIYLVKRKDFRIYILKIILK